MKDYKKTKGLLQDIKTDELFVEFDDIQEFDIESEEFDIKAREIVVELERPKGIKILELKRQCKIIFCIVLNRLIRGDFYARFNKRHQTIK